MQVGNIMRSDGPRMKVNTVDDKGKSSRMLENMGKGGKILQD